MRQALSLGELTLFIGDQKQQLGARVLRLGERIVSIGEQNSTSESALCSADNKNSTLEIKNWHNMRYPKHYLRVPTR